MDLLVGFPALELDACDLPLVGADAQGGQIVVLVAAGCVVDPADGAVNEPARGRRAVRS